VTWLQALAVLAAGIGAGTINTVVGSGTLITFPVLLGIGLSPVTANVTNTLGLVPGSVVGAYGYRDELEGQRQRLIKMGSASVVGAVIGATLLLTLPGSAFKAIVPVLVALALVLVIVGPWLSRRLANSRRTDETSVSPTLWLATMATGIYGGYFGAAQGIMLIAIMGVLTQDRVQRINAVKNVLAGLVNLVAAIVFVATAHIDYTAAGLIAVGATIGGFIGAKVGRRLPPALLRGIIGVVGIVAIIKLLV
jgi:uncharacterized protein